MAAAVLLYASTLHYGYRDFVAPAFAYAGLGYRSPSWPAYAAMVGLTVAVALLLPRRLRNPSDFVLWMLFCLAGAPSILIAQYNDKIPPEAGAPTGVAVAVTMLAMRLGALARPHVSARILPQLPTGSVWIGLLVVALVTYAALLLTSGITVSWLPLDDVYTVRSDFGQYYSGVPLLGYLVPVVSNVIDPLLIARGILARSYLWLATGVVGQYILYVTTGNKVILFSIPALAGLAYMFRGGRDVQGSRLLLSLAFISLATMILDLIASSRSWTFLVLRRFIIVPGALTAGYVYVFLDRPKTHFADSPLKWLESPYGDVLPSFLVGSQFVGDPTTNATASLFGHGFAAYGYAGMVIEGLALVPVLWLLDLLAQGLSIRVSALVLLVPSVALASSTVFTSVLTNGLWAAALALAILPRAEWSRAREPASDARSSSGARPRSGRPPGAPAPEAAPTLAAVGAGSAQAADGSARVTATVAPPGTHPPLVPGSRIGR